MTSRPCGKSDSTTLRMGGPINDGPPPDLGRGESPPPCSPAQLIAHPRWPVDIRARPQAFGGRRRISFHLPGPRPSAVSNDDCAAQGTALPHGLLRMNGTSSTLQRQRLRPRPRSERQRPIAPPPRPQRCPGDGKAPALINSGSFALNSPSCTPSASRAIAPSGASSHHPLRRPACPPRHR
jgi:hypothetical protein